MRKYSLIGLLLAGAVLFSGCNLPDASAAQNTGPQAWVDAPLTGSIVPLAPLDVVSHASDAGGTAQFELGVDGSVVRSDPSPDTTSNMVTMHQTWQPGGPGTYVLSLRSRNNAGVWSMPILVTVIVAGREELITQVASATLTATGTVTPAVTYTSTLTPTPATPIFTLLQNAFCRKGPDVSFSDVTAIPLGDTVDIQGVSTDGFWYFVFWKKFNAKCWVAAHSGRLSGNLDGVLVLTSVPTATQTPVGRPRPTFTPTGKP